MSAITRVRRHILETPQSLDEVLANVQSAGGTIAGFNSEFVCKGLKRVAFVCDSEGRHPVAEKLWKIVEWPASRNVMEAVAFIGIESAIAPGLRSTGWWRNRYFDCFPRVT